MSRRRGESSESDAGRGARAAVRRRIFYEEIKKNRGARSPVATGVVVLGGVRSLSEVGLGHISAGGSIYRPLVVERYHPHSVFCEKALESFPRYIRGTLGKSPPGRVFAQFSQRAKRGFFRPLSDIKGSPLGPLKRKGGKFFFGANARLGLFLRMTPGDFS